MVEDRVTDGKRVAQLLASELSGRETGPLADVSVVDADPDAEPAPAGTLAYRVAVRGERVATVWMHPDAAVVEVAGPGVGIAGAPDDGVTVEGVGERARTAGLPVEVRDGTDSDGPDGGQTALVRVESGAAVKRAVDVVVDGLV